MSPRLIFLLLCFGWTAIPASAQQPPITAELRLRDTSYFAGSAFHFYIRVLGADQADPPRLQPSDPSLQVRYIGAAASSSRDQLSYTFTYEALPLQAGTITIPSSLVTVQGNSLTTPPRKIEVAAPIPTEAMELRLALSQPECFVGEPVTLKVSWISALSLNGIKALALRLSLLTDPHFRVKQPANPVDPTAPFAVGLPVANQRVIARFSETTFQDKPAVEISFEQILVPLQPSTPELQLPPSTLLCSYAEPTRTKFQGTRYPSYFNNDFFDQDITGAYQRLFIQAPPVAIRIKPLPPEQKPRSFSGIVGAFSLTASASPTITPALSPVTLKLTASGFPFPHLLELPPWKQHTALDQTFLLPEATEPQRGHVQPGGNVEFSVSVRPRSEATSAIPSLEFAYFDPRKGSYELVRTPEIPLTVSPASPATVYDLQFADGSQLRNEVEPVSGGITHNAAGSQLLIAQVPHTWTLQMWVWLLVLFLPPLAYVLLRHFSKNFREARANPEIARREFAFRRFRKALLRLPNDAQPFVVSQLLRTYFSDRFNLVSHPGEEPDLASLSREIGIETGTAETLSNLVAETDVHTFARHGSHPGLLEKQHLIALVRQFEIRATKLLVGIVLLLGLTMSTWAASSQEDTLREACTFFDRANQTALVNPAQAQGLYRLAAARYESLVNDHHIRNGSLYYNLGNTYFLAGDLGRAVVNYLRAMEYIPTNRQLLNALQEARLRQVDDFPQGAPTQLRKAILFWHYHLGPRGRFLIIAAASIALWSILAVSLFLPLPWRWRACATLAGIMVLAGGSSLLHARNNPRCAAVVVQPEILPRKGDAQIYDPAFTNPLHSGAEVTILEQRRDWLRIRVKDGNQGWIPAPTVERVVR